MGKNKAAVTFLVIALLVAGGVFWFYKGASCVAGGGGAEHAAPAGYSAQKPVTLELELVRWGAPQCLKGKVTEDYSEVKCHFRLKGDADYIVQPMEGKVLDDNRALYTCAVPALKTEGEGDLEYFFDFKMNGVYSRRDEKLLTSVNQ